HDEKGETVVKGSLTVTPPFNSVSIMEKAVDNF
ncbi:enoyl-CoA hydratase, partial [Bacillus cereus]|nr:enoyl-CoA hydratase [Bacillus cereus]